MLIVVLVVCLGLVSLALLFGHSMLMAYRGSDDDLAGRQAEHVIEGAARYAEFLMTNVTNDGDFPDVTTYQSEAVPVGDALFWFIGVPVAGTTQGTPTQTSIPTYGLVDEASKLNLNRASASMLDNLPGMSDDLAQAIVSWRSTNGAGVSLVAGGLAASSVKNAPFESVEELAQVDGGIDLDTLYGNDANLNHVLDPWEDTGNGQLSSGLLEYVTVSTREPNVRRDGTRRVDITKGGRSLTLASLLNSNFPGGRGSQIRAAVYGTNPREPGRDVKSVMEFFWRGKMTAAELGQITPYLTMSSGTYNAGLVNVNTASQVVLSCIPGITYELAGQIVAARLKQSTPWTDLSAVAAILGASGSYYAGPYLTTRSYQVSADVAAAGRHGRGYRRTLFVIDSSNINLSTTASGTSGTSASGTAASGASTSNTTTAQIVYRRDLAGLGWALGPSARQSFAIKGVLQ